MRSMVVLAAALAFAACLPARANTYTQTLSQSYLNVTSTVEDTGGIATFNPALGTLNSVTQTLSGTVFFIFSSGTGSYTFGVSGPGTPLGNYTSSASGSFSISASNDGSGFLQSIGQQYVIEPFDLSVMGGSLSSVGNVTDTFTFNYTPNAAVTPEPPSILLLGTALLAAATVLRRRMVSQKG